MPKEKSAFNLRGSSFEDRLAEAIAWCTSRVRADDPQRSLRSQALTPNMLDRDRTAIVDFVAAGRARLVSDRPPITGPESLRDGRLVVYFPDANLADGAASESSCGYFDVHNVPPWDTWIALACERDPAVDPTRQHYLIAWVPPELRAYAQAGIDVNPEECIAWLDTVELQARRELSYLVGPWDQRIRTEADPA